MWRTLLEPSSPFLSPIYKVKKAVSKKRIKGTNPARVIGLIWSTTTVRYKVSRRRAILVIGSTKHTIGRHLGGRYRE